MKVNIRLSLDRLTSGALLLLLENVAAKITGNPHFPEPKVPPAELLDTAKALSAAIEAATNGSIQSKLRRNDMMESVKEDLRAQANYVRSVCGGDRTMLESSGFQLMRDRTPIGLPGTPINLVPRMSGREGEAEVRWKAVHGAHTYQVWFTDKDPELHNSWNVIAITTKVRYMLTGLESYKVYWVCITAIGAAGESAKSRPVIARAA